MVAKTTTNNYYYCLNSNDQFNETASSLLSAYMNFNVHRNMLCTQAAGYQGIVNFAPMRQGLFGGYTTEVVKL